MTVDFTHSVSEKESSSLIRKWLIRQHLLPDKDVFLNFHTLPLRRQEGVLQTLSSTK